MRPELVQARKDMELPSVNVSQTLSLDENLPVHRKELPLPQSAMLKVDILFDIRQASRQL
jgi:hypothetical protein